MKRQEMLSRIRSALDRNDPTQLDVALLEKKMRHEFGQSPDQSSSKIGLSKEDLLMRFAVGAKKNSIDLIEVENRKNIPSKLKNHFSKMWAQSPILCFENEICELPWRSEDLTIHNGESVSEYKVGMSLAWGGIAETGTLMLLSSRSSPTFLSFLAEIHIIILKASQIFNTMEEAFAHFLTTYEKERLPHSINLISGASRTGDIGGHIVHGAHGPIQLAVVLIRCE